MDFKDLITALNNLEPASTAQAAEAISKIEDLPNDFNFPPQLLDVWTAFDRLKDLKPSGGNVVLDASAQKDLTTVVTAALMWAQNKS